GWPIPAWCFLADVSKPELRRLSLVDRIKVKPSAPISFSLTLQSPEAEELIFQQSRQQLARAQVQAETVEQAVSGSCLASVSDINCKNYSDTGSKAT
ncbi:hypothetical protein STEG23_007134, partial [Scotinomys teguina]